MKKITKFILPSFCAVLASFSVNASNTVVDAPILPSSNNSIAFDSSEPCYASYVVDFQQGTRSDGNPVSDDRSNPEMALHKPDGSNAVGGFVSLGTGGYIILGFDGVIYDQDGDDFMIYETSFAGDNCTSNTETALIEFSQDGSTWVTYGEACLDESIDIAGLGLEYVSQIKITDTANSPDGYDVDGVVALNGCQELPQECYAYDVKSYSQGMLSNGNPMTNPSRLDPNKALGQPEDDNTENFVSLGYSGEIVLGFDGVVRNEPGDDLTVVETTFNNRTFDSYPESADVYVSQNGVDFYWIGSVYTNESASFDIDNALTITPLAYITQVKVVDTTPEGSVSDDAFDLDGIIAINGCSEPDPITLALCSASELLEYVEGETRSGGIIDGIRTETPENVLGYPEGTDEYVFTTLGYGGSITVSFGGAVLNNDGPDLQLIETSFNRNDGCGSYPEYADVYVSFDNTTWHMAGTVCKENNTIDISDAGAFEYIYYVKVVNNDEESSTHDAYDLDGIIAINTCNSLAPAYTGESSDDEVMDAGVYPNPVNDAARVRFVATENGNAGVELYDFYGRNISTLFNEDVIAGREYNVDFSANNIPNGVYLCKITNNNVTETKKIIISH
jgi:hypothetical protein